MADYDYGLDSDIRRKREANYDQGLEEDVRNWIGDLLGQPIEGDLFDALKDGTVLCNVANTVKPGIIRKINKMRMPFMQMENISSFLAAAKSLGVPQPDLFMTVDLYERKNTNQVIQTLISFGRVAQKVDGYSGPLLGAKLSDKHHVEFTEEQLRAGKYEVPTLTREMNKGASQKGMRSIGREIIKTPERSTAGSMSQQTSGYTGGESQKGMTAYGNRRQITPSKK